MTRKLRKLYLNAGQMKAGTSFLYTILNGHKQIFFSEEKEIHYLSERYGRFQMLSDDMRLRKAKSLLGIAAKLDRSIGAYHKVVQWADNFLRPTDTEGWYEDIFDGHREDQWCGDFSNLTCTIPEEGLKEVGTVADDIRVTYCLRDPVSRAISHTKFHLRFAGLQDDLTNIGNDDLRNLIFSDNIFPQSQSEDHITALYNVFGRERFRIVLCESLWNDPRSVLDPICEFLDISKMDGPVANEPVNVGPPSTLSEEVKIMFDEVFAPLRERERTLLQKYRDLVIG